MSIVRHVVIIAASMSVGAVLGATFAPQHESGEAAAQRTSSAPAPTPALETFYVPAQIFNQAIKVEDQPDAF
jgi:streptogramin lyase